MTPPGAWRLRAGAALQFCAVPGSYLYDCHAGCFAPVEHGGNVVSGFVAMYLARYFGVGQGAWGAFLEEHASALAALDPGSRDAYVAAHAPRGSLHGAIELARFVYPSAERYLAFGDGPDGSFALRDEYLHQGNIPLRALQARTAAGQWEDVIASDEAAGLDADARHAIARALSAGVAPTRTDSAPPRVAGLEAAILSRLRSHGALEDPAPEPAASIAPGVYLTGHSGILVRGARAGILIDPIATCAIAALPTAPSILRAAAAVDAVALTHGHFDHYHLPTLLALGARALVVPHVPRASIVCEDLAARLRDFGVDTVRTPRWGERLEVGDVSVHVLPFHGEQFLTHEEHPDVRNRGNCYVVEARGGPRVLVAADAGFETGASVLEDVAAWVARHGPIDVVAAQAIALRTAFGGGDPDLLITALTCAHRAGETLELLRPERRVTLGAEDIPDLCRAAGARRVVLYGQFRFARGEPGVDPALADEVERALRRSGLQATVARLRIGEGLAGTGAMDEVLTLP